MHSKESKLIVSLTKKSFVFYLFSQVFFPHNLINHFAMIVMCGMVALLCLIKKRFYFNFYFLFTIFFILQSYTLSVNGISINPQTSLAMTYTSIINFIIALMIYNYVLINDNLEKNLYTFAKIGILFTIFIIIFSLGNIFEVRLGADINYDVIGNTIKYNANATALIAGFSFLIFFHKYNKTGSKLYIIPLIWLAIAILFTGSRKGFILLIMGMIVLTLLRNPRKKVKSILIVAVVVMTLLWLIMYIPLFYNIIGYRMEALIDMYLGVEAGEGSVITRSLFIERGMEYFLLKPWIGYGLDCFRCLPGSYGTYSHNNYIELLVSGGIPLFFFYYAIRIIVLVRLYLHRNKNNINKLLFAFLLLLLILEYGLVSYFERVYIIFFIFILAGYQKIGKKETILESKSKNL